MGIFAGRKAFSFSLLLCLIFSRCHPRHAGSFLPSSWRYLNQFQIWCYLTDAGCFSCVCSELSSFVSGLRRRKGKKVLFNLVLRVLCEMIWGFQLERNFSALNNSMYHVWLQLRHLLAWPLALLILKSDSSIPPIMFLSSWDFFA